jgi:HEAT repeat protein
MFIFGNKASKIEKAVKKGVGTSVVKLIKDPDMTVRLAAIDAMGATRCHAASNDLINMLQDPDAKVRAHVAGALAGIGDVHAKAHIANASSVEKDPDTKAAMIKAIAALKDF